MPAVGSREVIKVQLWGIEVVRQIGELTPLSYFEATRARARKVIEEANHIYTRHQILAI